MKLDIQLFAEDAEVSIKFNNKVTGEGKLKKYAETLKTINAVMAGMNTGVAKQLQSSASSVSQIDTSVSDINNKVGAAFNVLAVTKYASAIKKLGAGFTSLAKQSMDYLENFNLFQVAFNGNYNGAERFINKMTEMYSLDESWLTQTVGKFKQLTNAMNLTAETGEKVSTLLTQMSLDISSLYNVDIDKAASTLSSAMAGQTKPIRGVTGGDITQATLQTTLDNLGIEQAVSNLSYAEKRLLIIISLTKQLNASIGDMGRTIESPANQLRIMNEQWQRLTRAVGNVFLPILSKILPYLNAILMVLTEIISVIAALFGYKQDDFDYFDSAASGAWDLDEGLKSAGSSAKKLKQGLRGFDKLNVITTPTSSGGGGGAGGGAGGINPKIMEAFNKAYSEYQEKLKDVHNKATAIRDKIMDWLGFTRHVNEETDKVYFTLDKGLNRFKIIVGLIGTLAGFKLVKGIAGLVTGTSKLGKLLGTGGLYNIIKKIIESMKVLGAKDGLMYVFYDSKLGKGLSALTGGFTKLASALGLSTGALGAIVAAILAVAAAFVYAYKTNDEFREKVNTLVATIKETLVPIFETLMDVIKMLWEQVLVPLWNDVIKPLAALLVDILTPIFEVIIDLLQNLFENIIQPLIPVLKNIVNTILKVLIKRLEFIIKGVQTAIDVVEWIWKKVLQPLLDWLKPILEQVAKWIGQFIVDKIQAVADGIKWLWDNILTPIIEFLKVVVAWTIGIVIDKVEGLYNMIKKAVNYVKDGYNNYIKPIVDNIRDDIKTLSNKVSDFYNNNIKPIIDKIKDKIKEFKDKWEDLKKKFTLPDLKLPKLPKIKLSITYDTNVGKAKTAVYKALGLDGWPKLSFASYAKGGLPPAGQIFVANEKGAELVGNIGGQSFVANQNQVVDLIDKKLGNAKSNPINATFVIQVGNKEIAKQVITDLQDMAKTNGKPITIGSY